MVQSGLNQTFEHFGPVWILPTLNLIDLKDLFSIYLEEKLKINKDDAGPLLLILCAVSFKVPAIPLCPKPAYRHLAKQQP